MSACRASGSQANLTVLKKIAPNIDWCLNIFNSIINAINSCSLLCVGVPEIQECVISTVGTDCN